MCRWSVNLLHELETTLYSWWSVSWSGNLLLSLEPKFYFHYHRSSPLEALQNQHNPVHTLTRHFSKIAFNVILAVSSHRFDTHPSTQMSGTILPFHHCWFNNSNNVSWRTGRTNYEDSLNVLCYFGSLKFQYSPLRFVSKQSEPTLCPKNFASI
jgi:hypothetical protein